MHEFDKCRFCDNYSPNSKRLDKCDVVSSYGCIKRDHFTLDVHRVIDKARQYGISVTDVLNLMREATKF